MTNRTWTMQEIVKASGATSRTLRHYQQIGLLEPCGVGAGGQRRYDADGLLRLQRILVLRELGVGLPAIGRMLDGDADPATALREHLTELDAQRRRLETVAASVRDTITMIDEGGELVADTMFHGFDHTEHREEVEERWGARAYADADAWWRSLSAAEKQAHHDRLDELIADFADASARGIDPAGEEAQAVAARQYEWVATGWGGTRPSAEAFAGLGQMYVDDPRFGRTYSADGRSFAAFVRDAMAAYAREELE